MVSEELIFKDISSNFLDKYQIMYPDMFVIVWCVRIIVWDTELTHYDNCVMMQMFCNSGAGEVA